MPRKSSVRTLPEPVRREVDRLLTEGVATLDEIVAHLAQLGADVSRSALHRYGQKYEATAARLRQSREVTEALARELGDAASQGKQGRLLVEMTRTLVFDLLVKLQEPGEDGNAVLLDAKDVANLGKGLAELGRALRFDQDFESKLREAARREAAEAAAETVERMAEAEGISAETRKRWRAQVLGIADVG